MVKLLKFNGNWADEINLYGMKLVTNEQLDGLEWGLVVDGDKPCNWYFGTNEGFDNDETWKDLWADVEVIDVSDEELNILTKTIFGTSTVYGLFPPFPSQEK